MSRISDKSRHFYKYHGWSDNDIDYLITHAHHIEEDEHWVMGVAHAPDNVIWLYPTSPTNVFPLSLWKRIKWYIENNDNVVIPMDQNTEAVISGAKRYNGYLVDNAYMFGDELKNVKSIKGGRVLWHR